MAKRTAHYHTNNNSTANLGFEEKLWGAADKLRSNMDAAEYKQGVCGLIFLKYISDAFTTCYKQLELEISDPQRAYFIQEKSARIRDDKIELNRRINHTLEDIARASSKSWFIDFDPVRAKMEGRDKGLSAHIADLFPTSFQDSELGQIPSGWRVGTLGETVEFAYGKGLIKRIEKMRIYQFMVQMGEVVPIINILLRDLVSLLAEKETLEL